MSGSTPPDAGGPVGASPGLGRAAVRGTLWVAAATHANNLIALVVQVWLMRLLAPEVFGAFALAWFFLGLSKRIGGFGFNYALVHRQESLDRAVPTHLVLTLVFSLVSIAAVLAASPYIRARYGAETAAALLALAAFSLFEDTGNTPRVLLEKALRFRAVMVLSMIGTLACSAAAVALAYAGAGVYALVARYAVPVLISFLGCWALAGARPRLVLDRAMIAWFFRFGGYLWLGGLATYVLLEFDDFLVGTIVGTLALGFYDRAYRFASLPTDAIAHVVSRVAFPLYSRLQHDRARLSQAFRLIVRSIYVLCLPAALLLSLAARPFTALVLGPAWEPMVPLLQLLVVYAMLRPIFATTIELFVAIGQPRLQGRIMMLQAAILILICPPATKFYGAAGAAVAVGVVMTAGVVAAYHRARAWVDVSYRRIFLVPTLAALVASGACALLFPTTDRGLPWLDLATRTAIFAGAFCVVLLPIEGRRLREDAAFLLARLRATEAPVPEAAVRRA